MKLNTIGISNYRSIAELSFPIQTLSDGTRTFGLIGVNEAGKSSILKALTFLSIGNSPNINDFRDVNSPIRVTLSHGLNDLQRKDFLQRVFEIDEELYKKIIHVNEIVISHRFEPLTLLRTTTYLAVNLINSVEQIPLDVISIHDLYAPIFWSSEDKYLISHPIDLDSFAADPESISIPLKNCFLLAGIIDIIKAVAKIHDSTEKEYLEEQLGESVTNHIQRVWPGHPVKITFSINGKILNFHIKDLDSKTKATTATQRSDGFKQFVSFLLTISAQNRNEQLSNVILLIDEPETHLHPKAQQFLLNELKEITNFGKNNIVFFATHSTFLIDKTDLTRNYRVFKDSDGTKVNKIQKDIATYNAINFEVFEIYSTDYHNELYTQLHLQYINQDVVDANRESQRNFDKYYFVDLHRLKQDKPYRGKNNLVTLPTYIRNCINHAENGDTYTSAQLEKSTDLMRGYLNKIN